jgi:hypothetical protein
MRIDIHIHTEVGSPCSSLTVKELIQRAIELGLDGVCITEHNTFYGVEDAKQAGRKKGLLVLGGMEVRCKEGDFVVFARDGLLEIEEDLKNRTPKVKELITFIHERNGVIFPVHPYRVGAPSIRDGIYKIEGFDGIEVLNGNSSQEENSLALLAAKRLGLIGLGGSDAHSLEQVGVYTTVFEDLEIRNEQDLIDAIKSKKAKPSKMKNEGFFIF